MKWIVLVIMVALSSGCVTMGLEDINLPQQVTQYYEKNVWKISNNQGTGSAFHITDTLLITNAHVVEANSDEGTRLGHAFGGPPTEFFLSRKDRVANMPIKILRVDELLDLALLRCIKCPNVGTLVPYILHPNPYPQGTRAFGGGWALGYFSIHTGFLQTIEDRYLFSDVNKAPGDSGSPLIVLEDGIVHVVGVRSVVMNAFGRPVYHKGASIRMSVVEEWLSQ